MPKEIRSSELVPKDLYAAHEVVVDQSTARRLEDLCSQMTDTCGLIEATLQLAVKDVSNKREALIKAALDLSARGTKSIKLFLCEWGVLVEESKRRENSARFAENSGEPTLALVLDSITTLGLTARSKLQPLAEVERRAVINAMQETGGDKIAASRLLGIGKTTLYRRLKEYDLTSWLEIPRRG